MGWGVPSLEHLLIARGLMARAGRSRHRLALVLAGSEAWTASMARSLDQGLIGSAGLDAIRLSDRAVIPDARPLREGTGLIGGETDLLTYDAWSGLDPDVLGAAAGTIRAGGLLILLTPPLSSWHLLTDPQAGRIAVWPHPPESVSGRFIRRLATIIATHPAVTLIEEGSSNDRPPWVLGEGQPVTQPTETLDPTRPATQDQGLAVDAIVRTARGRARRPLVITADRGRGKSAALGMAAARLLGEGFGPILVTAPRRAACEPVFRHASLVWTEVRTTHTGPAETKPGLCFLPPDALIEDRPGARLLLVDEAAGIPAPMLASLLAHYPRVVFATTVHGYEGTGRGFDCRFRSHLNQMTPDWHALTLHEPIRWSAADPLESFISDALLLDASPADASLPDGTDGLRPERLDRESLANDETKLSQVFGLLVLAHYQTRPMDLRMLLDGPSLRVYALGDWARRDGRRVLATLLAAEEGSIDDPALRQAIYEGRRRPRGHLIPQTLSAHAGLAEAPALSCLRVVRIAVHPDLGRRGLGRRMILALSLEAQSEGIDLVGASFGATPGLIAFWSACGLRPAQIGTNRNAASGEHALVMLRPISDRGHLLARQAEERLERRLGVLLAGPLRRLDPRVAATLAGILPAPSRDDVEHWKDLQEITAFALGNRPIEPTLPALAVLVRHRLGPAIRAGTLDLEESALLIAATRQLRPLTALASAHGRTGQSALLEQLRELIARLIPTGSDPPIQRQSAGRSADEPKKSRSDAMPAPWIAPFRIPVRTR